MSMSDILRDLDGRMKKSVEAAQHDFATLRTGRANPALLDSLKVVPCVGGRGRYDVEFLACIDGAGGGWLYGFLGWTLRIRS